MGRSALTSPATGRRSSQVSQTVRTVAQCGGSRARNAWLAVGQTRAWREAPIRRTCPTIYARGLIPWTKDGGEASSDQGRVPEQPGSSAMQACGEILRRTGTGACTRTRSPRSRCALRDGSGNTQRDREPDLSGYDRFITWLRTTEGKNGERQGPDPVIPETRRRRASTTEESETHPEDEPQPDPDTQRVLAGALRGATQSSTSSNDGSRPNSTRASDQTPAPAQTGRLPRRQDPRRL